MSQLWFEFVHSLNLLLYSYHDLKIILFDSIISPVDKTSITKYLRFILFSIEYQNDFITDGFDLLRNDYGVVPYDFIHPTYDNNWNRVFLSLYSVEWCGSCWYNYFKLNDSFSVSSWMMIKFNSLKRFELISRLILYLVYRIRFFYHFINKISL